ncbi:hypothetical protein PR202_gb13725 [Eleusine coracana subsp. coracana]|uniref:F-box domain-containing protein n=1 Tax=Eleusine coracana subsp. coracana TaxID=191504 RepID=A0AAV5ETC6_ELECO|nr:hypothetical protein PR202_gb13725 [Eleusine coracana subsp. coracana]
MAAASSVLPDDALAGVFRRLPARSLAASRRVCKAWRALIDAQQLLLRLRHLLPHSVRGINYIDHYRPHFFARPTSTPGPQIDGEFRFIAYEKPWSWYSVQDHCNGLVLRSADLFNGDNMYVINPATRRWDHLPPCGEDDDWNRRAFIVFDPAVSPHYEVLMAPPEEGIMPSSWRWHVLSSTTKTWEEKVFVREGHDVEEESVSDHYCLTPDDDDDGASLHIGREHCMCIAVVNLSRALDNDKPRLRVWILNESADKRTTEWLLKHQSSLNPHAWWTNTRRKDDPQQRSDAGPWIMDDTRTNEDAYDDDYEYNKKDWDSDDDNIIPDSIPNNEEEDCFETVDFLGFHPYKEVIFLSTGTTVACHLNNAKARFGGAAI